MKRQEKNISKIATLFNKALIYLYANTPANDADDFAARAHRAFGILFPNRCISYDEIDYRTGVVTNAIDKPLPVTEEYLLERWKQWSTEHPCIIYRRAGGTRTVLQISDFITDRQFMKTSFYNEFWKLLGIRHQLSAVVPLHDRVLAVSVNRDTIFTSQEVELMTLMQLHLTQAYQISKSIASGYPAISTPLIERLQKRLSEIGDIEVVDGLWKGNVTTGKLWRKS